MLRWINLALALVLATLLLMELTGSRQPGLPVSTIGEGRPTVAQERPGRRSRRMEARMAIEEARRQQRERLRAPAGPVEFDEGGRPIMD